MPRYGLILATSALLAMSMVGSAGAAPPALTAPLAGSSALISGAAVSGLKPAKRAAKRRALRNCRKVRKKVRRKACLKRVHRRFKVKKVKPVKPPVQGPIAATIDVRDKFFAPDAVNIRRGQSILWVWSPLNSDAHNVDLVGRPAGVRRLDFSTPNSPSVNFEFRRTFKVPGTYSFVCSIHHLMTMTVEVSK